MQGKYFDPPPYLISPLAAAQASGLKINYAFGTDILSDSTADFPGTISATNMSDMIFAGDIDNIIEAESMDRFVYQLVR